MNTIRNNIEILKDLNHELEQTLYGTDSGGKSYYDEFWDNFQNYGNGPADGYEYAFMYRHWTDENFKPKYDINGTKFYMAFYATGIKDVPACLERQGVVLDISQSTSVDRIFALSKSEVIPSLDVRQVTKELYLYGSSWYCHTVGTLILKDDGSQTFNVNCFYDMPALENISFEGTIGSSINFGWSKKLTVESMLSVINHLKNYKDTESDLVNKVTFTSECWDRLESTSPPEGYESWKTYVNNLGWNI